MVKRILLLLFILLSLSIDSLGIWANSAEIVRVFSLILFTATFLVLDLWKEGWVKVILTAGSLCIFFVPYHQIVMPSFLALLILFASSKYKTEETFALKISFITLILAYFELGILFLPVLRNVFSMFVTFITSKVSIATPVGMSLSGWASLLFSLAVIILTCKSWKQIAKTISVALGIHLLVINALAWALTEWPMTALQLLWLYPLGQWFVLSFISSQRLETNERVQDLGFKKAIAPLAPFFVICIIITTLFIPQRVTVDRPIVTLINSGVLVDFKSQIPVQEPFGFGFGGSPFSMLPEYLESFGFKVNIVPSIQDVIWDETDVVVLINFNEEIEPEISIKARNFVTDGGSLCIIGDHTDMEGITRRMNSLTDGMGILLNDDTADPILFHRRKLWRNALQFHNDIRMHDLKDHADIQIWGGASLSLKPWAVPLVSGKYGFQDSADPLNLGFGGRIGDRRLERGEMAGDVVLVASSEFGEGRVLFFGDTSSFQLPGISSSWLFLNRLFWWMVSENSVSHAVPIKLMIYLLGFLIILLTRRAKAIIVLFAALVIGICVSYVMNASISRSYELELLDRMDTRKIALINTSHAERLDLSVLSPDSGMGLAYNLMRCGLVPIFGCYHKIEPRAIFISAPSRQIDDAEATKLIEYVENGGVLFLAAGWDDRNVMDTLLKKFEVEIQPIMMGPVPWRYFLLSETLEIEGPDFKEAWPINILNPQTSVPFYKFEEHVLITITKKGDGKFILIGDHRFLIAENLEQEQRGNPANIELFRNLVLEVIQNVE